MNGKEQRQIVLIDDFSWLIGQIYDAAIDPAAWPDVLAAIARFADAERVTLALEDAADPQRSVVYQSYSDPDWTQIYLQSYMLINPMRLASVSRAVVGDIILTSDFATETEYSRTRLSREWLAPRDLIDIAVAVLEKTSTTITVLSLKRSTAQGFADEALRRKLELIAPHVKRAAAIGRVLDRQRISADNLANALSRLSGSVFLVNASGTIVHANESAVHLLAAGHVVRDVGGKIFPLEASGRTALAEALAAVNDGDVALGPKGTAITFAANKEKGFVGVVMPLTTGTRYHAAAQYDAVAAVCLRQVTFEIPSTVSAFADLYDLTAREMTIFIAVVENGGVPEAAAVLGLSKDTVKTHLKTIFRKTGAKRQADLVKLIGSAAMPFG